MPSGVYERIIGVNYYLEKQGFQKGSRINKGRKHTKEHNRKIGEAKKGKNNYSYIDGRYCDVGEKEYMKTYYQENKEEIRKYKKKYRSKNKEKIREKKRVYARKQRQENLKYRLDSNMSLVIRQALKGNKAGRHWEDLIGYTLQDLIEHLEGLFEPWMNWGNWGRINLNLRTWNIDHIKAKSLFNYSCADDEEFKLCWALDNLQPLEAMENIIKSNKRLMKNYSQNQIFLITGGAGFFGQRCAEILLKEYNPKIVRIYDNREFGIVEMERKLEDDRLRFLIGDVRDKSRLDKAMKDVDIVIHAAALKHVPICEYNPQEAVKTNINGARNVIECAESNNVEKVMMISTDKAVHPVNLYGATKMVSEKLFIQGNIGGNTKFSCSRYGNVIGSRGSVIPLFKEQKGKCVTITDERMTRFWISLDDGIHFVLNSIDKMQGGEIFVPKIPSMKIIDLADVIAPDTPRKVIGMKPGEKLNEMLISEEETYHTKEFDNYFIIEPQFSFWGGNIKGKPFGDRSGYTSDNNSRWITKEEIKQI